MFKHDAEYLRRRRRAQVITERDPISAAKSVKRGRELQRLKQLSWPRSRFGDCATITELMSEATESDGQRRAMALAIQAYIWIRYAVNRRVAIPHSLPASVRAEITSNNVNDDVS
jgi:hypothetical protein